MVAVATIVLGVSLGSSTIALDEVWRTMWAHLVHGDAAEGVPAWTDKVVWLIRLPRVLLALVVGAGLSLAGVVLQALVRNPLAEPYLLGISSVATTGAAVVMVLGVFAGAALGLAAGAFVGAMCAVFVVFWVARSAGALNPLRLILSGVAMGGVFSAVTSFLVLVKGDQDAARAIMFWTLGSLSSARWAQLAVPAIVVVLALAYLLSHAGALNAIVTGDEQALALGVDVQRVRIKMIIVASLLTGVLVAVAGVVGFVGLMIPHMVRMTMGADHYRVLPVACLAGGVFLVWVDLAVRTVLAPTEIPLGILTAVIGAPVFIYLMRWHSRREAQ